MENQLQFRFRIRKEIIAVLRDAGAEGATRRTIHAGCREEARFVDDEIECMTGKSIKMEGARYYHLHYHSLRSEA